MLENYTIPYNETTNQILLISDEGVIIDAESILFKNCIGKSIDSLHPFFYSIVGLLTQKNKTYNFECVNLELDGTNYTIDATLYINNEKEPSVFVFQELTKQYILLQKAAQKRNVAEIKSQLLSFNNSILQEKEAFKNKFIANFSSEIKTPVNTINGFVSLLENTNLEQSQRYNLDVIKNTNDKLKTMISDIIDISKIEADYFPIRPIRYNLHEELNLITTIFTQKCKEKGLTLKYNIDPECPKYVIADKYRLAQIVNNIIGNAIKFTPTGSIELTTECVKKTDDSATLLFKVKDTGVGIEQKEIDSIFNSFHQITNSLVNNGVGLGLTITKKLIHALKGTITLESEIGVGSTFSIALDFKIAKNQKDDATITKTSKTTSENDFKILLADPLRDNQEKLLTIISKLKNCDVVVIEDGDQVIEELYKTTFDLVILNLKLPTTDGLDTTRYIRHSEYKDINKIPIVVISENPSKEEEAYCKQRRVNSYIGKPFVKAEILRKLKYIIQKKQA
ncbi:hybrid sensor histidine kinase/response regulator [Lacinutrix algicola]|uniref:ATP-binding response regulator n=1 Tax=Lacinutrix algicola TaxID=342954 RepID=UPI0006E2D5C7|nr:ATP-binding protein [Lacinutrix algicola]